MRGGHTLGSKGVTMKAALQQSGGMRPLGTARVTRIAGPLAAATLLVLATACQSSSSGPSQRSEFGCLAGTVTGAVAGGLVGSAFGGGSGQRAMTGLGVGVGALGGNALTCN
jgi:outer membrane lipoprotein SlyB